jgi:hypothetical protein
MMSREPFTVLPSASWRTGSFSWPLMRFRSGLLPVVKKPKGWLRSATSVR